MIGRRLLQEGAKRLLANFESAQAVVYGFRLGFFLSLQAAVARAALTGTGNKSPDSQSASASSSAFMTALRSKKSSSLLVAAIW